MLGVVGAPESRLERLRRAARASLSGAKVPRQWEQVDELPRNPNGKILKRELRERYAPLP